MRVHETSKETVMFCNTHNRLVLQFHITGRCNLRCKHCYRTEGDVEALTFDNVKDIINQFLELCEKYNAAHKIKKRGHINITGGEPFVHRDIKKIITYLGDKQSQLTYSILSNGSFINQEVIELLKQTKVSFVQLSIDGDKKTHDFLRAPGDYVRVFKIAEMLEKAGVRTHISFTANKENYKYIPKVAQECRRRGITKLWSDRLVPIGNGEELERLKITDIEMPKYIGALKRAQGSFVTKRRYPKTQIAMNRALQFIGSDENIYSCSAGDSLITVDEFGRVMPCRRLPIMCGDVFNTTLTEIYYNNKLFKDLRKSKIPDNCRDCDYNLFCRGGAKCQSYAIFNDLTQADPACPIIDKRNSLYEE